MKMISNYIVIEGIDGSGKSLICELLTQKLQSSGYKVLSVAEPSKSSIGALLRNYLKNGNLNQISLSLLFAADSYYLQEQVKFSDYDLVISDRNYLSTVAYQMIEVDKSWLYGIHRFLCMPKLLIYFDTSPEIAYCRIEKRNKQKDIFETIEYLKSIYDNYKEILDDITDYPIIKIDTTSKRVEQVYEQTLSLLNSIFGFHLEVN